MKKILVTAVSLFLIFYSVKAQSPKSNYSLLWEITGGDLVGKSYVFGSAHINNEEAFDFPDSLFQALKSCDAFAAEVDMDSIGGLMLEVIFKEIDKLSDSSDSKNSSKPLFYDSDGKETYMDLYLHRVAKMLGKETYGLESLGDQMDLLSILSEKDSVWDITKSEYQSFVELYARGDIFEMSKAYGGGEADDFEMIERNKTQANSIIRLGKDQTTFSVVGAAHLFGNDNVLELLRKEGYNVRKVLYDRPVGDELEKTYLMDSDEEWTNMVGFSGGYQFISPNKSRSRFIQNSVDFHIDVQLDLGLIYATASSRLSREKGKVFMRSMLDSFIEYPDKVLRYDSSEVTNGMRYDVLYEGEFVIRMKAEQLKDIVTVQIVMGVSSSSLEHSNVEKYLTGLSLLEKSNKSSIQESEEGAFKYFFEENVPWQSSFVDQPGFTDRGKVEVKYKLSYDSDKSNSYLVRYHHHLPGVIYTNEFTDLVTIGESFASSFKAELVSVEMINLQGYNGADILLRSDAGEYYVKAVIRGLYLYALVQGSSTKSKNEEFFSSLELLDFGESELSRLESVDKSFSLQFPPIVHKYRSEDDGSEVMNYESTDPGNGSSVSLEVTHYGKYEENIIPDSLFTLEGRGLTEEVDSVLHFETFTYQQDCPSWRISYLSDSLNAVRSEIEILANNKSFYFSIYTPMEIDYEQYVDQILSSFLLDVNPHLSESFRERKLNLIFEDLQSTDSVAHAEALEAYAVYDNFIEEDISQLLSFLHADFLDESDLYNTKYYTISNLHEFDSERIEQELVRMYDRTENEEIKSIILESLSNRNLDSSIPTFIELLKTAEPLEIYADDFYSGFSDSLALYERSFPDLLELAKNDIAADAFFDLSIDWLVQDSTLSHVDKNKDWYEDFASKKIDSYVELIETDSSFSPHQFLMDYYYYFPKAVSKNELYGLIEESGSDYGQYRMIDNQLVNGETINTAMMTELFERDIYYLYWIGETSQQQDRWDVLGDSFTSVERISEAVMNRYVYDNYSVELSGCEIIDTLDLKDEVEGVENMYFLECEYGGEDGKYYGLVGSFSLDGNFDFNEDVSVYYNTPKEVDDPMTLIPTIVDYLKDNN